MPRSMTGFGQASLADREMSIDVVVRCVNGKHLKTKVSLGAELPAVEERVAALVARHIARGTVEVTVRLDWGGVGGVAFNERVIASYVRRLEVLRKKLGLSAEVQADRVALLPGAMMTDVLPARAAERVWRRMKPAVVTALERAVRMKVSEGRMLAVALRRSGRRIRVLLRAVEARVPAARRGYRKRLAGRVSPLLEAGGAKLESGALARELIFYAERTDISEELCRMKAHVEHFFQALRGERAGRQLEFIAQEMHREANTMASKASDPRMTELVIDLRGEVDKIREQVLNLE